jgi:genome maintenance exonuclease 1
MVGVYRGKPAVIDFKQSTKPKKREWIEDYFHQLGAYALAHDIVHGTNLDYGVVLMAVQDGSVVEFSTTGREFQQYKDAWMKRVEQYYESITTSDVVSTQTLAPQDNGLSAL